MRKCLTCGIDFLTKKYRRCSRCRKRIRDQKRRARIRKAFVERVNRQVLYDRDKGICQICKRPVPFENFHIDHIIPIARGGKHSYLNTQISHAECNRRKGSKLRYIHRP